MQEIGEADIKYPKIKLSKIAFGSCHKNKNALFNDSNNNDNNNKSNICEVNIKNLQYSYLLLLIMILCDAFSWNIHRMLISISMIHII